MLKSLIEALSSSNIPTFIPKRVLPKVGRIEIRCHKWAKKVKPGHLSHGNPKIIGTRWSGRKVVKGFFVEG